jgi:predicted XRE-type DNA-binding protein
MKRKIKCEASTGNVFADIGLNNPEEALAKAEMARQVNQIIATRELTQGQAGEILGIDQPRVSALSKGRLSLFSLEKLMQFASRLGNEVEISIKPSDHSGIKVTNLAKAVDEPSQQQCVVSTAVLGGHDIQLSFFLGQPKYGHQTPIKLDRSEMVSVSEGEVLLAA